MDRVGFVLSIDVPFLPRHGGGVRPRLRGAVRLINQVESEGNRKPNALSAAASDLPGADAPVSSDTIKLRSCLYRWCEAGRRARGSRPELCQWLVGHVLPLTDRLSRRSVSHPYWVTVQCGLEHSSARLALSQSGCPLSFLFVSRLLINSRESARVLDESFPVLRAKFDLERVVQPLAGQGPLPTDAVLAQIGASPGFLALLVNFNGPLRTAYNASQFSLGLYLLTLNAGPQWDVLW